MRKEPLPKWRPSAVLLATAALMATNPAAAGLALPLQGQGADPIGGTEDLPGLYAPPAENPVSTLASSTVYLGTPAYLYPGFSTCSGNGWKGGTPWLAGWAWWYNCGTGDLGTYAIATAQTGLGSDAHAEVYMQHQFTIARRCSGQGSTLTGSITPVYWYSGKLFGGLGVDEGRIRIDTTADGSVWSNDVDRTQTTGTSWPSEQRFPTWSILAAIGQTRSPGVHVRSDASAFGFGVTSGESDFGDADEGRQVRLQWIHVDWSDATPPSLSTSVSAAGSGNGWHRSPATVSATAKDGETCARTVYHQVDGGAVNSGTPGYYESPVPFPVSGSGVHSVRVWADNYKGGTSGTSTITVKVDGTAPSVSHSIQCAYGTYDPCVDPATVTISCVDSHSGCRRTYYRIDGGPWIEGSSATVFGVGQHTVDYYGEDYVGLMSSVRTAYVDIDCNGQIYALTGICAGT